MMLHELNESTFRLYAAANYDNPQCYSEEEFNDDLARFKYLKRLFNRYVETGELCERLILNHLITIYNVFGVVPATRMLFWKLRGFEPQLKPFLIFMNNMPDRVYNVGGTHINSSDIALDAKIVEILRKL